MASSVCIYLLLIMLILGEYHANARRRRPYGKRMRDRRGGYDRRGQYGLNGAGLMPNGLISQGGNYGQLPGQPGNYPNQGQSSLINPLTQPYRQPGSPNSTGMQVEVLALYERDPALLLHNRLRRHLAKGRVDGLNPQMAPTNPMLNRNANFVGAQRMYKLTWDVFLEDRARYYAMFCQQMPATQQGSYNTQGIFTQGVSTIPGMSTVPGMSTAPGLLTTPGMGLNQGEYRNVHISNTRATRKDLLLEAVHKWWNEMSLQYQQIDLNTPMQFNDTTHAGLQNWKNMAASFMTRMGCAVNVCGRNGDSFTSTVVCLYANDPMNIPETAVFIPGQGCMHDADCSTYPQSSCRSAYCVNEANELPQEIEEEFRSDIIYEINKLRRQLAHGHVANNGANLPPMSNIYKLEWARDLEERAQRIALQCHANIDVGVNTDVGYNVYVDPGVTHEDDFKKRGTILESAIHAWWNEVNNGILPQQCPVGQEDQCYQHMRNFVNMAYYRATDVGCAINHDCNNQSIVVCLFKKGNQDMRNRRLYQQGRPCFHDRECTEYGDSWCETHTGLCVDVAKGKVHRAVRSLRNSLKRAIENRNNSIRQRVVARVADLAPGPCRASGTNFYKVRWNNKLEQRALAIASWCRRERRLRYQFIGENFYVSHNQQILGDYRQVLKHTFSKWLHESEANRLSHFDDAEKRDHCINYNNMLYGGYVNVACAVNFCNEEAHRFSLAVCLYQRGKKVPSEDIKIPFTQPCTSNTTACSTYRQSMCEPNTGLCVYTKDANTNDSMFLNNNGFNYNFNGQAVSPNMNGMMQQYDSNGMPFFAGNAMQPQAYQNGYNGNLQQNGVLNGGYGKTNYNRNQQYDTNGNPINGNMHQNGVFNGTTDYNNSQNQRQQYDANGNPINYSRNRNGFSRRNGFVPGSMKYPHTNSDFDQYRDQSQTNGYRSGSGNSRRRNGTDPNYNGNMTSSITDPATDPATDPDATAT